MRTFVFRQAASISLLAYLAFFAWPVKAQDAATSVVDRESFHDIEEEARHLDIQAVYASAHGGWSLDEVIIRDDLRALLMEKYREAGGDLEEQAVLETLLAIRKSGKLAVQSTRSVRHSTDDVAPAAEIAARRMVDEHGISLDKIFLDPNLLAQFDRFAADVMPEAEPYLMRKAALRLRKSRQLRPELLARVTDWKVLIQTLTLHNEPEVAEKLPKRPGIYIFRDRSGYLYIGQSKNLKERLSKHLDGSDRIALAEFLASGDHQDVILELHVFQDGSPAESSVVREAYESELIRTRKPRLNIAP